MPELPRHRIAVVLNAGPEQLDAIDRTVRMIVEQDIPWVDEDTREALIGHLTGAIFVLTTDRGDRDG